MEEWPDLLADADLENEDVVLLFRHGEPGPNGWEAMHWGRYVQVQEDEFLVDAQRDEANADGVLGKHRVATWDSGRDDDMTLLIRVAALRHELEHARQWDQVGPIPFQMTWMVDDVLRVKLEGVPGGSLFYNFKPLEQDANAAASVYVRRTRHADLVNVLARSRDHGQFARSLTPPPDPRTVRPRRCRPLASALRSSRRVWALTGHSAAESLLCG
jgi:hypothetical protein